MKKINKDELNQLFIGMKNNNEQAFNKLYNTYNKLVYSIAFSIVKNKQDAEDIMQIVFTKIYSIEKNKLPSENEASWLYSVTKNETINFLKKRNNNISLDNIYEIVDNNNEINKIIDKEKYNKLIERLNDEERDIISLKILSNLSFDEIGKILRIPTGTVKWKYYKSIHALKILLSNLGMFIVTSILGVNILKNQKNKNLPVEPDIKIEENISEDKDVNKEETKKEENSIFENSNSLKQENIIEISTANNTKDYIGIGFIGVSSIFLIITIIFSIIFTKYQLKCKKKLSK